MQTSTARVLLRSTPGHLVGRGLLTAVLLLVIAPTQAQITVGTTTLDTEELVNAVVADDLALAKSMLKRGADPNVQLFYDYDPLTDDLSDPNDEALPLLVTAVYRDQQNMAQLLLEYGADPNVARNTEEGLRSTMFNLYVSSIFFSPEGPTAQHTGMVRLLLEHGADPDASYSWDGKQSPLLPTVVSLVAGRDPSPERVETVRLLLEHGADTEARIEAPGLTTDGFTALMYVAEAGRLDLVRLLLEHGAEVDPVNSSGQTALDLAGEHKPVARLLREHRIE